MQNLHKVSKVDEHVGHRIQIRREGRRLTIATLAAAVELSEQQMADAEYGQIRLSASKIYTLSKLLDVPVAFFFAGYAAG